MSNTEESVVRSFRFSAKQLRSYKRAAAHTAERLGVPQLSVNTWAAMALDAAAKKELEP